MVRGCTGFVAALFLAVSLVTGRLGEAFGTAGLYAAAAIVGIGDLDAITIRLATAPITGAVGAVLIATATNNIAKGCFALGFGGQRAWRPASVLLALAPITLALALGFA